MLIKDNDKDQKNAALHKATWYTKAQNERRYRETAQKLPLLSLSHTQHVETANKTQWEATQTNNTQHRS